MCACLQELLSQDGFPSEKVTNLEKSHFMSAVLRYAPPVCSGHVRLLLFVDLLYVCGVFLQRGTQQTCLTEQN